MHYNPIYLLSIFLFLCSCISDPVVPVDDGSGGAVASGMLVVNEGVWFQDNSTLTHHDPETGTTIQNYFRARNPGMRLGDLGNSITVSGSRAYIPVTTSQTIEVLELPDCISAGRVRLPPRSDPRQVVVIDSTTGFVTNVNDDSIIEFNPTTLQLGRRIPVGPAPEGIAYANGRLFVANSGYGMLRQDESGASTVSVIDAGSLAAVARIPVGANPRDVIYSRHTGMLYVLFGLPEEQGGVMEIDPVSLETGRSWPVNNTLEMALDDLSGTFHVIGVDDGLWRIDPTVSGDTTPELFVQSDAYTGIGFYSVGADALRGEIYIGFSSGFTVPGEVLVVGRDGALRRRFDAGLNPGAFGAY